MLAHSEKLPFSVCRFGSRLVIFAVTFFALFSANQKAVGAPTFSELKEAERLSLALTGKPLSQAQRDALINGSEFSKDVEPLVDDMLASDSFVWHQARFWSEKMGISGSISLNQMKNAKNNKTIKSSNVGARYRVLLRSTQPTQKIFDNYFKAIDNLAKDKRKVAWQYRNCNSFSLLRYFTTDIRNLNKILETKTYWPITGEALKTPLSNYQKLLSYHNKLDPNCSDTNQMVDIKAYWVPKGEVWKVPKYLAHKDICGVNGERCGIVNSNLDPLENGLFEPTNLEPGLIIGKTVADDLPFKNALTTTKTVMNGKLAKGMQDILSRTNLWHQFPGGKFQESKQAKWLNPNWNDESLFWVERTPLHAGVSTTFAYQMTTNGKRAKANRLFETFTCSKFVVPEGILPDPSDSNPDLRKRTYCAACHRTLEPMAAFFNRWPSTGNVNYLYNASEAISDEGSFDGGTGSGAQSFSSVLASTPKFDRCAVQRGFEFFMGRTWSESERDSLLPKLLKVYDESGKKLKPVIRRIALENLQTLFKFDESGSTRSTGGE